MHLRSGFTIVELSIAILIIGLVAGAVFVGRDLIHAAALRAQIERAFRAGTPDGTVYGRLELG